MATRTENNQVIFDGSYKDWQLRIRRATKQDYDDVMNIDRTIFKGGDYLPSTYDFMVTDATAYPFVVESEGKVVGFVCLWLDGLKNTSTGTTAARLKLEYRHKGLAGFVGKMIQAELKKNFPTLLYDWRLEYVNEKVNKYMERANERLVEQKHMISGYISAKDLPVEKGEEWINIKITKPTESELSELLCKPAVLQYLFPSGVCSNYMGNILYPATATEYFIKNILAKGYINISGALESHDLGFSTAFVYKCPAGLRLDICYDGSPQSSIIKAHILEGLADLEHSPLLTSARSRTQTGATVLVLVIVLPSNADFEDIFEFVRNSISSQFRQIFPRLVGLYERMYNNASM